MNSISKNVYIDKLDDIVIKYNNTYQRTIILESFIARSNTYINCSKETNDKDSKFKIGVVVRISKYIKIFGKDYVSNWSEELFVINRVKNAVMWTYIIGNIKGEEFLRTFYGKEMQKTNQNEFIIEKVINIKCDNLLVNKSWFSSFKIWCR